eukprot:TRINITY_DN2798_c1_g1_i2.p1 TRINITY_DN2798_c1_g1~~TRINITY_DN2798_c1_g1_i2.p1  ORF type:complete len:112 (-),score=27.30 TRINITY_DN2798_c1_g1_i2:554-865(-)
MSENEFPKLVGDDRVNALKEIPNWQEVDDRDAIKTEYMFKDFKNAFAFMTQVADFAEENDHHPEWFNVYNKINVTLSSHFASGVTQKDIDLAKFMDQTKANFE